MNNQTDRFTTFSLPRVGGRSFVAALCCVALLAACGGEDNGDDQQACDDEGEAIEVAGTWTTNFGSTVEIDNQTWASTSSMGTTEYSVVSYDNCDNRVIRESESSYNKVVWTEPSGDQFYYCTVAFQLGSEEEARNAEVTADFDNPEEMGSCGDFAFTKVTAGTSNNGDAGTADTGTGDVGTGDGGN